MHLIFEELNKKEKRQWKYYIERKKKEAKFGMEQTMLHPTPPVLLPTLLPTIDRFRSSGVSLENQATASRKIYDFSKLRRRRRRRTEKGGGGEGGGRRRAEEERLGQVRKRGIIPRGEEPILGKVKRTCIYNKKKCISTRSQYFIWTVCLELIYRYAYSYDEQNHVNNIFGINEISLIEFE